MIRDEQIQATYAAIDAVARLYADDPDIPAMLAERRARLDQPLRVALVGKVKAGKSTVINALIGEQIAATDTGECTRVLTVYEYGRTPAVTAYPIDGEPSALRFARVEGALRIDLGSLAAEDLVRIVVQWPSRALREMTLLDTPGIDSISTDIADRTLRALDSRDGVAAPEADAVVYLMRHLHASDLQFLDSSRARRVLGGAAVSVIGVLSRADEIGAGRIDAMIAARRVAQRYAADPALSDLMQTVVPVAGLLAEAARTMRPGDLAALRALAASDHDAVQEALMSADRFRGAGAAVDVPAPVRADLVQRYGLFGIRLALAMLRGGMRDEAALTAELARRSGFDELRAVLASMLTRRGRALAVHSAMEAIAGVLKARPRAGSEPAAALVEQVLAGSHQVQELSVLADLRRDSALSPERAREAVRLLGGSGLDSTARLGLPVNALVHDQIGAAEAALSRWLAQAEDADGDARLVAICDAVARSCEGILDDLASLLSPSA